MSSTLVENFKKIYGQEHSDILKLMASAHNSEETLIYSVNKWDFGEEIIKRIENAEPILYSADQNFLYHDTVF